MPSLSDRVSGLRRAFDLAFAVPAVSRSAAAADDLLGIRVGDRAYALRLSELSQLLAPRRVVPLPSRHRAILGLVGVRGAPVAVCSLAALLGDPTGPPRSPWLALARSDTSVALAFDAWDGIFRVRHEDFHPRGADGSAGFVREVAVTDGIARPVVGLRAAIEALKAAP
jgi:chemotaxis signal transduction protein